MPNANVLKQKQEQVAALAEKMKNSAAGVVVDYRGITVADDTKLRRELREAGYTTYRGNTKWSNSHILKILKNEKYVGDLVQKKSITPDYLTHDKKRNHGEEELVVIENHHRFAAVQS